jgi:hypothetical protein
VEISVWQKDLDSPFSFEFTLGGETVRCRTRTRLLAIAARHVRDRVNQELRKRKHKPRANKKTAR